MKYIEAIDSDDLPISRLHGTGEIKDILEKIKKDWLKLAENKVRIMKDPNEKSDKI